MSAEAHNLDRLGRLPFERQLHVIDDWILRGSDASALLSVLGEFPDHEPLAYAVRRLASADRLRGGGLSRTLAVLLGRLPETGVQRVLKGVDRAGLSGDSLETLRAQVEVALAQAGLSRLGAFCLMDRWLKNAAPSRRRALSESATESVMDALREGDSSVGALSDNLLMRLPGRCFGQAQALADSRGVGAAWRTRLETFCGDVMTHLQQAPRSLSQANAEEILSRRVYTDPGHFIVELLQNAEDCAARTFELALDERAASVWHDGAPFDARDVVGVLSIGQTTKSKDQIGFFGVGFKAIYEVCERPRVHSSWFDFEIADISIPRQLAPRDGEGCHPEGGTLLVLPYRDRLGSERAPASLYERALAVPPETLLTLSHLTRFKVRHGDRSREVVRRQAAQGRVALDIAQDTSSELAEVRHYQVAWSRFSYEGEGRERGRSMASDVMVALALDAEGRPQMTSPGSPTIFSHLPTGERSGLRLLVHAHFELPVDRERLNLNSPWNRWALRCAGSLLAQVVEEFLAQLGDEAEEPSPGGPLEALWGVLPLPEELSHQAFVALFEVAQAAIGALPVLPGADGRALTPRRALWVDDLELSAVLAGVSWPDGRRACRPFWGAQGAERARQAALAYGAVALSPASLVEVMARDSGEEGTPWPHAWLERGVGVVISALGDALTHGEQARPGRARGGDELDGGRWLSRLSSLAWLPDQAGLPRRPGALRWAAPALRALVGESRPLIAPDLESRPTPGQRRILSRLGIARYDWSDFIADLSDPVSAAAIMAHAGPLEVLTALSRRPHHETRALAALPLFPDEAGVLRPLGTSSGERVWLAPAGEGLHDALALWLASSPSPGEGGEPDDVEGEVLVDSGRPALLSAAVSRALRPWLEAMGAETLELGALSRLVSAGAWVLGDVSLTSLHALLAEHAQGLSPRENARLAATPLFVDVHGQRRPVSGASCAWMPLDEGVASLAPDAPWLAAWLLGQPHIERMPSRSVGPREVVEALCDEGDGPWGGLVDVDAPESLRRAYGYLRGHAGSLERSWCLRLSRACIWRAEGGALWPLAALRRRPEEPDLAELHEALSDAPQIDDRGPSSALSLAEALGLGELPQRPDYLALVNALAAEESALLMEGPLREALVRAMGRAAEVLSVEALAVMRDAPLFLCEDGVRRALGDWVGDEERAHLAASQVRGALSAGPRHLMTPQDQGDFVALWEALSVPVGGVQQLILEAERVGLQEDRQVEGGALEGLSAVAVRRALRAELASLAELPDAWMLRASSLSLWPVAGGGWAAASSVVRPAALRDALGSGWEAGLVGAAGVLDESVEAEAEALCGVLSFRPPGALIKRWVASMAKVNEPLASQKGLLSHCEGLHRLLSWCVGVEGEEAVHGLPLSVNAKGELCRGVVFEATEEERSMCQGLALHAALAWRPWASGAAKLAPSLVPALPPDRLLSALSKAASDAQADAGAVWPPTLSTEWGRSRFYHWIMSHSAMIEAEPRLLGVLGNAPVVLTEAGGFKAPRDLLLGLEALMEGVALEGAAREAVALDDWRCSEEVPRVLRRWLRAAYRLESRSLKRLVEILTSAHKEAQAQGDGERSAALLGVMASAMREGLPDDAAVAEMARRLKVHRLRVEDEGGSFEKMSQLFCPTPDQRVLLESMLATLPRCVSARYDAPDVRWLMHLAGTPSRLDDARLKALIQHGEGLREGVEASLALARYAASALAEDGGLRGRLKLDVLAWIPDGEGERRAASDLYWPDSDLGALIGDSARLYPHPEWLHTAPEVVERLPFRSARDARVSDVVAHLRVALSESSAGAPLAVLAWFERGLKAGRLAPPEVAEALKGQRLFVDDAGVLRAPEELIVEDGRECVGDTLHAWSDGRRFKALAAALSVSQSVGPAQIIAYHERLAVALSGEGAASMLRRDPALEERLNRALTLMVQRKAAPWRGLLLVVRGVGGALGIVKVGDPTLSLAAPAMLMSVARDAQAPLVVPAAPLSEAASRWLSRAGVPTLDGMLSLEPLSERPGVDISAAHVEAIARLHGRLERLASVLPAAAATRWRRAQAAGHDGEDSTWVVRVAERLALEGRLVGREVRFEVDAALDERRGRLWVTPRGLHDVRRLLAPVLLMLGVAPLDDFVEALAPVLEGEAPEVSRERLAQLAVEHEGRAGGRAAPGSLVQGAQALERAGVDGPRRARPAASEGGDARPSPSPSPPPRKAVEGEGRGEGGWWSKVQKWFGGDDERAEGSSERESGEDRREARPSRASGGGRGSNGEADAVPGVEDERPFQVADHSRFFQPSRSVDPQLRAAHGWLGDRGRAPDYGFAFSPPRLDFWHRYAPKVMAAKFQPTTQRWLPVSLESEWQRAGRRGVARVSIGGRLPRGQSVFPTPMYARLVSVSDPVRLFRGRAGSVFLKAPEPTTLTGELVLDAPPRFEGFEGLSLSAPSSLLEHTVPSGELPPEALELVEGLRADGEPLMVRALAVREFIRERYRYDPAYMEDPAVARWLSRVTRGKPNVHIAALHAGADARHLGAGVCYELGALACELLRRAGVPSLVATGWTWDRGQVADADHMWSMALLPSDLGPRWLPVDASTTREGRPLHVGDRPRASWEAPPEGGARSLPADPAWSRDSSRWDQARRGRVGRSGPRGDVGSRSGRRGSGSGGGGRGGRRRSVRRTLPMGELMRVVRHLRKVAGESLSEADLERRCREVLSDPEEARRLLAWFDEASGD